MARAVALVIVAVVRAVWMGEGGISWASVVVIIDADGPVISCAADGAKACGVVVLQLLLSVLVAGWGEISLLRLLRPTVDEDESRRACDKSADDAEGDTDAMGTVS